MRLLVVVVVVVVVVGRQLVSAERVQRSVILAKPCPVSHGIAAVSHDSLNPPRLRKLKVWPSTLKVNLPCRARR